MSGNTEDRSYIPLTGETEAFRLVCDMEDLVDEVRTRKELLFCIASAETADDDMMRTAVNQLAYDFGKLHRALEDKRGQLFHILHPRREALDRQDEAERQAVQS